MFYRLIIDIYLSKTSQRMVFRQMVDLCSLLLVSSLLYRAYVSPRGSSEEELPMHRKSGSGLQIGGFFQVLGL